MHKHTVHSCLIGRVLTDKAGIVLDTVMDVEITQVAGVGVVITAKHLSGVVWHEPGEGS